MYYRYFPDQLWLVRQWVVRDEFGFVFKQTKIVPSSRFQGGVEKKRNPRSWKRSHQFLSIVTELLIGWVWRLLRRCWLDEFGDCYEGADWMWRVWRIVILSMWKKCTRNNVKHQIYLQLHNWSWQNFYENFENSSTVRQRTWTAYVRGIGMDSISQIGSVSLPFADLKQNHTMTAHRVWRSKR